MQHDTCSDIPHKYYYYYYNRFTILCPGESVPRINHFGFCWSRDDGVAVESAEPYSSYLHFAPEDNHTSTSSLSSVIRSHTLSSKCHHRHAALNPGSARDCVLVRFDFVTWRHGCYPHLGLVLIAERCCHQLSIGFHPPDWMNCDKLCAGFMELKRLTPPYFSRQQA